MARLVGGANMNPAREAFLERVRRAVATGNRAGAVSALPGRGRVGYQGAGPDPVDRFCTELKAAGGQPHVVADNEAATAVVLDLARARSSRRVLLGQGSFLDGLGLAGRLRA